MDVKSLTIQEKCATQSFGRRDTIDFVPFQKREKRQPKIISAFDKAFFSDPILVAAAVSTPILNHWIVDRHCAQSA